MTKLVFVAPVVTNIEVKVIEGDGFFENLPFHKTAFLLSRNNKKIFMFNSP